MLAQHTASHSPTSLSGDVSLDEKVRVLRAAASYCERPSEVVAVETHMSWVFMAGERVYKLKKPVRYPFLDFSSLAAREANCRQEVRLNRRLAPDIYLGVVPLTRSADGALSLDGHGEVVDWLVLMRRLPGERMFDCMLRQGLVGDTELDQLTTVLASFYRGAEPGGISPAAYADRFSRQQTINREVLTRRDFALDHGRAATVLDRLDQALADGAELLQERVRAGRIVDGHGDLRPEHICLTEPVVIFDCLEFNRELRLVDPFDETAFLGMECALLGARWVAPRLVEDFAAKLGERPPAPLMALYTAFRAVMRARLALAHLLDATPREPGKWEPLATRYLDLAEQALSSAGP
jgi:aminoglycoside phosphotransferase family enzyme